MVLLEIHEWANLVVRVAFYVLYLATHLSVRRVQLVNFFQVLLCQQLLRSCVSWVVESLCMVRGAIEFRLNEQKSKEEIMKGL